MNRTGRGLWILSLATAMVAATAFAQEEPPAPPSDGPDAPRPTDIPVAASPVAPAPMRCIPTSCAVQGIACGRVPDGCGGMVDCGACPPPPPPAPREPIGFRFSLSIDWPLSYPDTMGINPPGIGFERLPVVLFADGWDPRYTGYEDVSHALFYRRVERGRFTIDLAIALKVLTLAVDTSIDDSSYLRFAIALDPRRKRSLAFTLFPLSSDRMRLGYDYRTSWGGSPIFFRGEPLSSSSVPANTLPDPGLRVQYVEERISAWLGFKVTGLLNRNPSVNQEQAVFAALGGVAVEAVPDHLRIEVGGGYFDRGTNQNLYAVQGMGPYVDHAVETMGGSLQVSLWSRLPPSLDLDYSRYRGDPTTAARLLAPTSYRPGLSWLLQGEVSALTTSLQDPVVVTQTTQQAAWAFAIDGRLQHGHSRLRLDLVGRSLEFILLDGPSLTPFQGLPPGQIAPDLVATLGYDHRFERIGLTVGASLSIERPASIRAASTPAMCGNVPSPTCTTATFVVRGPGDMTVLPSTDSSGNPVFPDPMGAAKLVAREDFLDLFSVLLTLYYLHDPNVTALKVASDGTYYRTAATGDTVGLFLTLQARL